MCKARSVCKDWDFVSENTELSVGSFLIEYFTPLTLGQEHHGALSDEDVTEEWAAPKSEAISKVRKLKDGTRGEEDLTWTRRKWKRPSGSGPMAG